jgi:hypothetical protein
MFLISWNIILKTYRFLKQQIMILFSGTMKWNMFQIHLNEMGPWYI